MNICRYLITFLLIFTGVTLAEEVSVTVGEHTLKGELNAVDNNKNVIVFILPGSGPINKDGNITGLPGNNNAYKYLSEALNEKGFSTFRSDKRGVGDNVKIVTKQQDLRFSHYVTDAQKWINFLKTKGYTKVVLLGHSEGALIATLSASEEGVSHLICLAGAGRKASVVIEQQIKENSLPAVLEKSKEIIESLEKGVLVKDVPPGFETLFAPSLQPYLISWFKVDPVEAIAKVKVPVLIIHGTTDIQILEQDARNLHTAAKGSKLSIIKGMNHVLKEVEGDPAKQLPSYSDPKLKLHDKLIDSIVNHLSEK